MAKSFKERVNIVIRAMLSEVINDANRVETGANLHEMYT